MGVYMRELVGILGIPKSIISFVKKLLYEAHFNKTSEIFFVPGRGSYPRYPESHINEICKFALEKIKRCSDPPERLRFIYLPCPATENVLRKSFFLIGDIHKIILERAQHNISSGDAPNVVTSISELIRSGLRVSTRPARRDFKVLPPNNFIVSNRGTLFDLFKNCFDCASGDPSDIDKLLQQEIGDNNKKVYKDHRGCFYVPCKPTEQHVNTVETADVLHQLKGMYRFGWHFGVGFHHDVQHSIKQRLKSCQFECSINGSVKCTDSTKNVNIYLNDFVRVTSM